MRSSPPKHRVMPRPGSIRSDVRSEPPAASPSMRRALVLGYAVVLACVATACTPAATLPEPAVVTATSAVTAASTVAPSVYPRVEPFPAVFLQTLVYRGQTGIDHARARLEGAGYTLDHQHDGALGAAQVIDERLPVRAGRCYAVIAFAWDDADRLWMRLVDEAGSTLASQPMQSPGVWYCAASDATLTLRLASDEAPVSYTLAVYSGAHDPTIPREMRSLVGGYCDAYPGDGPVFPSGAEDLDVDTVEWRVIDLRDRSTWHSLGDVDGPVRLIVDAEVLALAPHARGQHLLREIDVAASCVPMMITVEMDHMDLDVPIVSLASLTRVRGLVFHSTAGTRVPAVDPVSMPQLRGLVGLRFIHMNGVSGDVTTWIAQYPRLRSFSKSCSACAVYEPELAAITALPELSRLFVNGADVDLAPDGATRARPRD